MLMALGSHEPSGEASASSWSLSSNIANLLWEADAAGGDRPAIVEQRETTTYRELRRRAGTVGQALVGNGFEPCDRAAILLPRGADAAAAYFGSMAAGAVAVFVNESLRPRQIEYIVRHSGARALLTSSDMMGRLPRALDADVRLIDLSDLPSSGLIRPMSRIGPDLAQIIYTSGSTGLPKGVTLSHGNLWSGLIAVRGYLGFSPSDRIASLLPFSFDYGLNQLLCSVAAGATLVVERSPVPARIVRTLREEKVTVLAAVPPLWLQLLDVDSFGTDRIDSLRVMTNTGGRLPTEAVRQLRRAQPDAALVLMYGLTEAFRSTYLPAAIVDAKPESIGRAIPGAEILVLRDDLSPCAPKEIGQLVHRGPTVALGYWDDPEATAGVFRPNPILRPGAPDDETVVFSGDLVFRDEEGDLFFVGRRDRMIKTLGYRVSPDEIVDVLYGSGEVVEAAVTSEPDDLRGAQIVAYVVLKDGGELARLERFCQTEMPRYMQPARIEVRRALDRTHTGKHDVAAMARDVDDPA
jgi:acyl-CoA synthetase (AMP-forming)/AMP-acid ligase II